MNDEDHVMVVLGVLLEEARDLILSSGEDGLRPSHFRVIGNVPPDGGVTITELGERLGMTKQGTGQFVTQLTEAGYLESDSDPDDRRVRIVSRTRLGHDATRRLAITLRELEKDWAKRVGKRRYTEFRSILNEIAGVD
jgi:DNA-binding MarR family transcriptional regulator